MKKPIVAVIAGGYSGEHSVSLKSAAGILSWLGSEPFSAFLVLIERDRIIRWHALLYLT